MASAPQAQNLPILYNNLIPLSSQDHAAWRMRGMNDLKFVKGVHAFPLTVDEFGVAQRGIPIVFSSGPDPVPLGLMGLNEGANVFIDDEGQLVPGGYLPAYIRRYPFMLARLNPDAEEMTLCIDPTNELVGPWEDGEPLFENGEATQSTKSALEFCEQFEMAAQRTQAFCKDLLETGLLEEGEVTISAEGAAQPYIYRGFQMVNEEKFRDLRGDQLRKMQQNGMNMLIYAHLMSLGLMSEVFNRAVQLGKVPPQNP